MGNNEELNIIPNIQIETHNQIIVSHKSVSNNTNIEIYKGNNQDTIEDENIVTIEDENIVSIENENIDTIDDEIDESNQTINSNQNFDNRCVICMENIEKESIIRKLNKCNHFFHINCIDKWFESKITCPTCRQDIRDLSLLDLNNES